MMMVMELCNETTAAPHGLRALVLLTLCRPSSA
jgi:hypothetical protein